MSATTRGAFRRARAGLPLLGLVLAMPFLSGCILSSRQVVLVAAPTATTEYFNAGVRTIVHTFDLTKSASWRDHHGRLSDVTDLTCMGTFANPLSGPGVGPTLDVTVAVTAEPPPTPSIGTVVWGPLPIEYPETQRVSWERGARLFNAERRLLLEEIRGDGRFGLIVISDFSDPALGGVEVPDFHLGAVLLVR